ncbi:uncharacterized protein HGUI_02764 [Hanseniaspora guilliermondii]|uniref:BZIP domain-containing protein n=1 Tax=Hanseniaspora guilliermondii TaxID=56406 RepID=A0A1L0B430_9ASCO|nr:uncharacterized protein HGUI_02764 [Hanseniaspora guilliermondii]
MLNEQAAFDETFNGFPEINFSVNPMEIFPKTEDTMGQPNKLSFFDDMNADLNINMDEFQIDLLDARCSSTDSSSYSPYSDVNTAVSSNSSKIDLEEMSRLFVMPEVKAKKVSKPRCSSRASTSSSSSSSSIKTLNEDKTGMLKKLNLTPYQVKPRKQALSEIDSSKIVDPIEAKRAKNTESARRSRARKMQRMQELELKVSQLLEENEILKQKLAKYE